MECLSLDEFYRGVGIATSDDKIPYPIAIRHGEGKQISAYQPCLNLSASHCWSVANAKTKLKGSIRVKLIKEVDNGNPMPVGFSLTRYLHLPQFAGVQWDMIYVDVADIKSRPRFVGEFSNLPDYSTDSYIPKPVVDLIIKENIGLIAAWRRYRNMSQSELAVAANLSVSTINKLENEKSKPRKQTLRQIARALCVKTSQLD